MTLDESGKPSFHLLQNASTVTPVTFFAFDLPMLEGQDLRNDRLDEHASVCGLWLHPYSLMRTKNEKEEDLIRLPPFEERSLSP